MTAVKYSTMKARERRDRIVGDGGRALYVLLSRDAAQALASLTTSRLSATMVIEDLLIAAARKQLIRSRAIRSASRATSP